MSGQPKKLRMEEGEADTATRSPPKKSRTTQTISKKKKLKSEAEKAKEKAAKLRLCKVEITPEKVSRMTKAQKRELYAAAAARSVAHREVEQYKDDNVGAQALNEGEKTAEGAGHYTRSRYARRLKKKAKLQADKKKTRTEKTAASDESKRTSTAEGEVHWFSRWKQRQEIRKSYYTAARSGGTAAQAAGSSKVASGSASAARSGVEQVADKGRSSVSAAVNGIANFAKGNAHALVVVGVFLLLLLLVMSAFSSCSILFSGTTHVSGQTIYTAEDRDIRGAEQDYKKLEKELDKKSSAPRRTTPATTSTSITLTPSSTTRGSSPRS